MPDRRPPKILTRLYSAFLLLGIALGWLFPQIGRALPTFRLNLGFTVFPLTPVFDFLFIVMFLSLLQIDLKKVRDYVARPRYWLLNLGFILVSFLILPWLWFWAGKAFHLDPELLFGLVFTIIAPTILLAPVFTEFVNGDKELAFVLSAFATLISPFIIPLVSGWLLEKSYHFNQLEILLKGLALIVLPLGMKILLDAWDWNPLRRRSKSAATWTEAVRGTNILLLTLLFCSIIGDNKGWILSATRSELWFLLGMGFIQDFGLYWLGWALLSRCPLDRGKAKALTLSLSLKNITLTIGMIQSICARAVLPGAVTFIFHAAIFAYITLLGEDSLSPQAGVKRLTAKLKKIFYREAAHE